MKKIYNLSAFAILCLLCNTILAQTTSVTFTSSATFTVPAGVNSITIEVVGAGGDGSANGGGGGGGGGYSLGTFSVVPLSALTVTVGTHGTGAAGGTTSVSTLISATGGLNGTSGGASPGGAGGSGSGGSTNYTGGTGGNGTWTYFGGGGGGAAGSTGNGSVGGNTIPWTGVCITPGGSSGASGGAPGGNGGKGSGFTDASCVTDDPATPGITYGGGGGGGNGNSGPASNGADGVCIISYCSINVSTTTSGVTITANAISPTSYQWMDCGTGLPIAGEMNDSYTATVNGSYAVIITDGDCVDTSNCISITTVSTNDVNPVNKLTVHPNPFINKITVENTTGNEDYSLTNSQGAVIWSGKNIEKNDFSFLPAGVYVLKIKNNKGWQSNTLIKK